MNRFTYDVRTLLFICSLITAAAVSACNVVAVPAAASAQSTDRAFGELMDRAESLRNAGRYEESLRAAQAAERRARAVSRTPMVDVARALGSQAKSLEALGRPEDVEHVLKAAADVFRAAEGLRSAAYARALNNLSSAYLRQERFYRAHDYIERAIAIAQSIGDRAELASGLVNKALMSIGLRDYSGAVAAAEEALPLFEAMGDAEKLAHGLRTLSTARSHIADMRGAETAMRRAVELGRQLTGRKGQLLLAEYQCELAGFVGIDARYDDALELYEECLAARQRLLAVHDPEYGLVADTLEKMADDYVLIGAYDKAIALCERAKDMRAQKLGADSLAVGLTGIHLAQIYWSKGDSTTALFTAVPASELLRKHNASDHDVADAKYLLAQMLVKTNDHRQLLGKALYEQLAEDAHRSGAPSLYWMRLQKLAEACAVIKDRDCAADTMRKSLAYAESQYGDPSVQVGIVHKSLATIYHAFGDYQRSAEEYDLAFDVWRKLDDGVEYLITDLDVNVYLESLWQARATRSAASSFRVGQLVKQNEAARALAQLADRVSSQASGSDVPALVRREQDLDRTRHRLQMDFADVASGANDEVRARQVENLHRQMLAIEHQRDAVRATLRMRVPGYRELGASSILDVQAAQALLRDGDLLITYDFGPRGSFVWGVTPKELIWAKLSLTQAEVETEVKALRNGLDRRRRQVNGRGMSIATIENLSFDAARAHSLYRNLLGPLDRLVAPSRRLLIVPSGPLESLPPSVLVTQNPAPATAYRQVAWLIRDKAIAILPSVSSLQSLSRAARPAAPPPPRPVLAIGDPLVDGFAGLAGCKVPQLAHAGAALASLGRLPGTEREVTEIATRLGGSRDDILLREQATEERMGALDLRAYRVLIFATHGLIAGEAPGVTEPALVLTPPARCVQDAGLLTASKVSQLALSADFVVLSACNTAAADGSANGRGLSGLARAFFYAGARAVLVSHWSVLDDAAIALTTRTFEELARDPDRDKSEALRRAMLAVMDDPAKPEASHPSYWAPFVLVGGL